MANMEGVFILKIPQQSLQDSILISSIGYKNLILGVDQFKAKGNVIKLEEASILLDEIRVLNRDGRELLVSALNKTRDNYSIQPTMVRAFYRESTRRNQKYVVVSEAVLDAYKAPYSSLFEKDRISILKARKSSDFQKKDLIAMKLQGGPYSMFQLDFIKNPAELLERRALDFYRYKMNGQVIIDNSLAYVISFEQLPEIEVPLYKGIFYIGVEDLAILGAEFHLDENNIDKADEYMVEQMPPGVQIDIEEAIYKVDYRFFEGKYYLSYVRTEIVMFVEWEKKLFRSRYTTTAEMAVTDIDSQIMTKSKNQNNSGASDIFIEQVKDFEDPGFWGGYNIISPEESIQAAVKRMGRKLRRKDSLEKSYYFN